MDGIAEASPDGTAEGWALLADLVSLCDGPEIELHLSFDGALINVRSKGHLIFTRTAARGWQKAAPRARARHVAEWLREAAAEMVRREGRAGDSPRATA